MKRILASCTALLFLLLCAGECRSSVAVEDEEVIFRIAGAPGERIFLVGDFNGWNPTIDLLMEADGGFEIRLYLLPGAYRYRYIVDGVSRPDTDNPCVDAGGNSCFVLVERNGALEIVLAESAAGGGRSTTSSVRPAARIAAVQTGGEGALYSAWEARGTVEERIDADLAVGMTGDWAEDRKASTEAFLLRGLASYRLERGALRVFSRPVEAIDLGDPAGLIGRIGPYRYPPSLFCRGVELKGTLPLKIDGRFLYLGRMRGYRSGLEGIADSSDLFSRRDFEGSDLYAFKLGTKIKKAEIHYLFREGRRPKDGFWRLPSSGGDYFAGYEENRFQGVSLSVSGSSGVAFESELLFGESKLMANGRWFGTGAYPFTAHERIAQTSEWEKGSRLLLGLTRAGERSRCGFRFNRTTLDGDRAMRGGRPDGAQTTLLADLAFGDSTRSIGLAAKAEQYATLNTGSIFLLARTNFWLDGDDLTCDRVPFLSSGRIYEARLFCDWNRVPPGIYPWGTGFRLEITERWDGASEGPRFAEIRLVNGTALHPRAAFLLDMRSVSYEHGGVGRNYVDAFLSIRGIVGKGLWCAVGTGVNPYAFDRWLYSFADHGRETYLADGGVFRALAADGEAASVEALLRAEESLAEDWIVTLEAGFTF